MDDMYTIPMVNAFEGCGTPTESSSTDDTSNRLD